MEVILLSITSFLIMSVSQIKCLFYHQTICLYLVSNFDYIRLVNIRILVPFIILSKTFIMKEKFEVNIYKEMFLEKMKKKQQHCNDKSIID